jgi:hypothetical protein
LFNLTLFVFSFIFYYHYFSQDAEHQYSVEMQGRMIAEMREQRLSSNLPGVVHLQQELDLITTAGGSAVFQQRQALLVRIETLESNQMVAQGLMIAANRASRCRSLLPDVARLQRELDSVINSGGGFQQRQELLGQIEAIEREQEQARHRQQGCHAQERQLASQDRHGRMYIALSSSSDTDELDDDDDNELEDHVDNQMQTRQLFAGIDDDDRSATTSEDELFTLSTTTTPAARLAAAARRTSTAAAQRTSTTSHLPATGTNNNASGQASALNGGAPHDRRNGHGATNRSAASTSTSHGRHSNGQGSSLTATNGRRAVGGTLAAAATNHDIIGHGGRGGHGATNQSVAASSTSRGRHSNGQGSSLTATNGRHALGGTAARGVHGAGAGVDESSSTAASGSVLRNNETRPILPSLLLVNDNDVFVKILRHCKRVGWDRSLGHSAKTAFFNQYTAAFFCQQNMGILSQ